MALWTSRSLCAAWWLSASHSHTTERLWSTVSGTFGIPRRSFGDLPRRGRPTARRSPTSAARTSARSTPREPRSGGSPRMGRGIATPLGHRWLEDRVRRDACWGDRPLRDGLEWLRWYAAANAERRVRGKSGLVARWDQDCFRLLGGRRQ